MTTSWPTPTTAMKCKVIHRETEAGKLTAFAHWSSDGKPVASSLPGWLSADECRRIVSINRERTET